MVVVCFLELVYSSFVEFDLREFEVVDSLVKECVVDL